jgi:hypothetical protein
MSARKQSIRDDAKRVRSAELHSTAVELSNPSATLSLLPLFARHERGEGRGEEETSKNAPPLPQPSPPSEWRRGRRPLVAFSLGFLNSTAVELHSESKAERGLPGRSAFACTTRPEESQSTWQSFDCCGLEGRAPQKRFQSATLRYGRWLLAGALLSIGLASGACVAEGAPAAQYTLEEVFQALSKRDAKYRVAPLRIEYSRTVNNAEGQLPQRSDCTLVIHWNNFQEEVRDAKGRLGRQHRVNGLRAETGRRWEGFELLLPYNNSDARDLGERIYYYPHDVAFTSEQTVALLVDGIPPWLGTHLRDAEKAGTLFISRTQVNGIPCVQFSAVGIIFCLAPQYDWAIVRHNDLTTSDFRLFGERHFPTKIERVSHLKDFRGGFFTYRESCEIRSVTLNDPPNGEFWKIPEPKPGTWIKVGYPKWDPRWDAEPGRAATKQSLLDNVRFEHAFVWSEPLEAKDWRIYEISKHWRDSGKINPALNAEGAHGPGFQAPLPFLSPDGARIVWATFDAPKQRLIRFDQVREKDSGQKDEIQFEAGFVPERNEILLGEPLYLTFYVTNTGPQTFHLETGGDSRGVRPDRFQFWAIDSAGQPAVDPNANPSHHGGMQGPPPAVAPGKGYTEKVYLPLWVKFERAGEYIVRGRRVIQLLQEQTFSTKYALVQPAVADFKLTVLSRNAERLGQRIAQLGDALEGGEALAIRAARQLADIDDDRVVPHLIRVIERANHDGVRLAVAGLGKHTGPEAAQALAVALRNPRDNSIRSAAAQALGNFKLAVAVDALVAALNDENEYVRSAAASALGKVGAPRAVEALKSHLSDGSMAARLACVEALLALGTPLQGEWVTPIIKSQHHVFQNAIWLIRRNAGPDAPALLIDCLDMANPSAKNYYNYTLVWQIHACGGPKLTYHHDFEKEGTPAQIEENKKTLEALRGWLKAHQERSPNEPLRSSK